MQATQSPTDYKQLLSRLCHLVALSETKKIEGVGDSLVLAAVEIDLAHPSRDESSIAEALKVFFGIEFSQKDLNASISRLVQNGALIGSSTNSSLALSPDSRAKITQKVSDATELEEKVKREWLAGIPPNHSLTVEQQTELWACLKSYLTKLFCRHGAQTALILSGKVFDDADLDKSAADLLSSAIAVERKTVSPTLIRTAIQDFFGKQTGDRARYIAQLLDGTFSFYTLFTDEATQSYLRKAIPRITIFLDTNFLFGVLDLHDNPQNEVSLELVELVRTQALPFDLYYHEESLAEMQNTIFAVQKDLQRVTWPSGLSRAVLQTRAEALTGIHLKFHRANAASEIDPATFFLKYRHLEKLLNEHGFKIYRRPDRRTTEGIDQATVELVSQYKKFLEERFAPYKPKPFAAIKHDITVWQAAKLLRHSGAGSLDVGAIFLSADQRLFAFDWGVLREGHGLGVVVLPSQLLQLLRPFVPRTTDFDAKFAEIFSVPHFRAAHSDFSKIVQRVLQFLASVKGISEETAAAILADEVLLRRLMEVDADHEIKEIIESEVLQRNAALYQQQLKLKADLQEAKSETDRHRADLQQREEVLREREAKLRRQAEELAAERVEREKSQEQAADISRQANEVHIELTTVSAEKQRFEKELEETSRKLVDVESRLTSIEAAKVRRSRWFSIIACFVFTLSGWVALYFAYNNPAWNWVNSHPHRAGIYLAAGIMIPSVAWSIFGWKGRAWALGVAGLGVLLQLIQIL
jgi:hypothetical protein